ncbi:MAG: hypothetical protein ACOH2J_07585 [Allorhizobium sp.]
MAETDKSFLLLLLENPAQDAPLFDGLAAYIDRETKAPFLNSLKLQKCGEWLGNNAPARLQVRLSEVSRSSQHPACIAFRDGLVRSGGLERAFPKADI